MLFDPPTQDLFERLCDLPLEAQQHELELVEDPVVREQVAKLLALDREAHDVFDTRGGAPWLDPTDQADPETLGRFRIIRRLGIGGMGVVYEAREEHPDRSVALKVMRPGVHSEAVLQLFRFEVQALAMVDHPRVPVIYEAGTTPDGTVYFSMELVHGLPLDRWVTERAPSAEARMEVLIQVAGAVHAAHEAGVLHRDLKPSNILVDDRGANVLDFGIAAPIAQAGAGAHPGTLDYMSPEALAGDDLDARSDVFSLGVLGYELLTGELPRPPQAVDSVDVDISDAVLRALAPQERRTSTAAELADDLQRALQRRPLPWKAGTAYRLERFTRRHRSALGRAAVLGGAVVTIAAVMWASQVGAERRRVQQAAEHFALLQTALDSAIERDDWTQAEYLFTTFADDPAHQGTPWASEVWLDWSRRLAHAERPGDLEATARAYLISEPGPEADAAQIALGRRFHQAARFDALWQLSDVLSPAARAELTDELFTAAVARRDIPAAKLLTRDDDPMLRELGKATDLGVSGRMAAWLDGELIRIEREQFTIGDQTWPLQGGFTSVKNFATDGAGGLWFASGSGQRPARLERLVDGIATPVAELPRSGVQDLALSEHGLWLALSYPHRGLRLLDPGGTLLDPHPGTSGIDSDVMDLDVLDLDGDGQTELLAAVGSWDAYDLRALGKRGGEWTLLDRVRLGSVFDVAVLDDGGRPLIIAGKVDLEPDYHSFPDNGFGPPAGLYAYHWDDGFQHRWTLPFPVADDPRVNLSRTAEDPVVGDFDGDGRVDVVWTVRHMTFDYRNLLWFVLDATGERRQLVVGGLEAYSAEDRDGDGDHELLVGDEADRLWILGAGDDALPVQATRAAEVPFPTLPTDDPVVGRTWARAQALADLGLLTQAARALSVLPRLSDDPGVAAASHAQAARLFEAAGLPDQAAEDYQTAVELGASEREGLLRTRLATLDVEGARAAGAPEAADAVTRDLLGDGLDPWLLRQPVFRPTPADGLHIEATNDQGVLARLPVNVEGPWVELGFQVDVDELELGAGLAVELRRGGRAVLTAALWGQGGGGSTKLFEQCGADELENLREPMFVEGQSVQIRAALLPEGLICHHATGDVAEWLSHTADPLAAGPAELVLRAHGDPTYDPPTRIRARLRQLRTVGIAPRPTEPDALSRGVRQLIEGHVDGPAPSGLEAEWAIARGDSAALRHALAQADDARIRRLLRSSGALVTPALSEVVSDEHFARLYADALRSTAKARSRTLEAQEALLRLRPDTLDPSYPSARKLRYWLAEVHYRRGERAAARTLARSLTHAHDDVTIDARLLLARLDATDPERATAHLEAAMSMAQAPELIIDRAAAHPELSGLIPAAAP